MNKQQRKYYVYNGPPGMAGRSLLFVATMMSTPHMLTPISCRYSGDYLRAEFVRYNLRHYPYPHVITVGGPLPANVRKHGMWLLHALRQDIYLMHGGDWLDAAYTRVVHTGLKRTVC